MFGRHLCYVIPEFPRRDTNAGVHGVDAPVVSPISDIPEVKLFRSRRYYNVWGNVGMVVRASQLEDESEEEKDE